MKIIIPRALALLAFALALPVTAAAQVPCHFGDDGFDLGCCKEAHPNLPDFPEIKVEGVYACVRGCSTENVFKVDVKLTAPHFELCDTAVVEIHVHRRVPAVRRSRASSSPSIRAPGSRRTAATSRPRRSSSTCRTAWSSNRPSRRS